MTHNELYFLLRDQLKTDTPDMHALIPILDYVQRENPLRMQDFVRFLAKVKMDLAEAAMDDRQTVIDFDQET